MTVRRVVVSTEALKRAIARSTKASAKLEGRELPVGFVRPAAVQRWIDQQSASSFSDAEVRGLEGRDRSPRQSNEP